MYRLPLANNADPVGAALCSANCRNLPDTTTIEEIGRCYEGCPGIEIKREKACNAFRDAPPAYDCFTGLTTERPRPWLPILIFAGAFAVVVGGVAVAAGR